MRLKAKNYCTRFSGGKIFLGCLVLSACLGQAGPSPIHYLIEASLDPEARSLKGSNTFVLHNPTTAPMDNFFLFLYPNHYRDPWQNMNDDLFDRVFPSRASPGNMRLGEVTADGEPCVIVAAENQLLADKVLVEIRLPSPLDPATSTLVSANFTVLIPQRYGSFGAVGDTVCLNGGWYPYLPPRTTGGSWVFQAPPADSVFELRLRVAAPGHVLLNQHRRLHDNPGEKLTFRAASPFLTLVYLAQAREYHHSSRKVRLTYITPANREDLFNGISGMADRAIAHLQELCRCRKRPSLLMVEAPLRRDLVLQGAGILLVSERFQQVVAPAREYHLGPLIEAWYATILQPLPDDQDTASFDWMTEAAAWTLAKSFWDQDRRHAATIENYLRPLSFIPDIDRFIKAPRLPFVGAFFGDFYATDPLREDILRFNRNCAHGRIIAEKIRDLLGCGHTDRLMIESLTGNETLKELLAGKMPGTGIEDWLAQWTWPYPEVNYSIKGWRQERQPTGGMRSYVTVRQTGEPVKEPVTIEVKGRFGPSYQGVWPGTNETGTVVIDTPARMRLLRIDPERRLRETKRADNRHPPERKLLLNNIRASIDLNGRDHEVRASGSVVLGSEYLRRYRFNLFSDQEKNGLALKHDYNFGHSFDSITHAQSLSLGILHADLDSSFADSESGRVNNTGRVAAVTAGYVFSSADSARNRLSGWTLSVEGEAGVKAAGGDFRYWKCRWSGHGVIPIARDGHLLAWRGSLGLADAGGTPTQQLFDIGGFQGVRGINRGLHLGNYCWLAAAEYRLVTARGIDANLLTLAWLRRLQLAIYLDAGKAGDRARDLLRANRWRWGYGLGLRLHVDTLGVFPGVWRFDAARQGSPEDQRAIMYYVGAGQSF